MSFSGIAGELLDQSLHPAFLQFGMRQNKFVVKKIRTHFPCIMS